MSLIRNLSLVAKAVADVGGLEDGQHHLGRGAPGLLEATLLKAVVAK